ncbi:MAG: YdcF family protein [Pseudolabrys sp.]
MLRAARITLEGVGLFTIFASIVGFVAFFELANLLQYENRPEKADFIFPLAGDAQRLTKAAQLYNEGFASRILLSNEINQRPLTVAAFSETQSDASALYLNILAAAGVSPDDIMQFGENLASTAEEAEALRAFLGNRPATILLVASPYEALRAKIIFARTLPGVKWLIICADQLRLPEQWWRDKAASLTVVTEVAKITYYLAGGVFRGPKSTDVRLTTQRESSSDFAD